MRKLIPLILGLASLAAPQAALRRAPGFALFDSSMQVTDLYDYHGKVVLLEFMQTDCPHCAAFADVLRQVAEKYGDKVQILSVVSSNHENSKTVAQFIAAHKVTYPVLFDSGQMAYSYVRATQLQAPHVYVIDGAGMIRGDYLYGPTTRDVFEGKALFIDIDHLLKK